MLSIGKLANGQADYCLNLAGTRVARSASVSSGVEDYYVGGAEPPGRWAGNSRPKSVSMARCRPAALEGVLDTDADGLPEQPQPAHVPGYDLTFSAPKSVSVVFRDRRARSAGRRCRRAPCCCRSRVELRRA